VLVVDPRPGNATADDATDNIVTLTRAVERMPGAWRHRMLVRLDGAGFSHELLEHIASGGGKRGRRWEFSVGWSCTDVEMKAITKLPKKAWARCGRSRGCRCTSDGCVQTRSSGRALIELSGAG
jgi:hypothetical protein